MEGGIIGNKEWGVPAYGGTMFSNDPRFPKQVPH